MNNNRDNVPPMTPTTLIIYIISIIAVGLFFFFVRGDMAGKLCAFIVCPVIILYLVYAYNKEKKADKNAESEKNSFLDGTYFESPKWHEEYTLYLNNHPFDKPKYSGMKKDLLSRYHRKEYVVFMIIMLLLMAGSVCCIVTYDPLTGIIGILLFGVLLVNELCLYIGMPVRKWLKGDIDYAELEASYLRSKMVTYKKNGFAFGTTHIHAFIEKHIYCIDYRLVEGISRKIVRLKKYENNVYSSEEYQHYAVINVRLPQGGNLQQIEIELNEFQVQMVIDYWQTIKNSTEEVIWEK